MAFDDLSKSQSELVVRRIEELQSGTYQREFSAARTPGEGWMIFLEGKEGTAGKTIELPGRDYLSRLDERGYVTLGVASSRYSRAGGTLVASLRPKAVEQYQRYKQGELLPDGEAELLDGEVVSAQPALENIAVSMEDNLQELRRNYRAARYESIAWFCGSFLVALVAAAALVVGIFLLLRGSTLPGVISAISGAAEGYLVTVLFPRADKASERQDRYHREVAEKQTLLEAVQLAKELPQSKERSQTTREIILRMAGVSSTLVGSDVAEEGLVILRAWWGCGSKRADVTERVRSQVSKSKLEIMACNESLVGGKERDPAVGEVKSLMVLYSYHGTYDCATVSEMGMVSLP